MNANYNKLIANGALVALFGFVLSGIGGTLLVMWLTPQPNWTSPLAFVQHYHPLQSLPFFFGFMLLGGMLMLAAGHYLNADERLKPVTLMSLVLTSVFATLIFFNYIVQTTFLRGLAIYYTPQNDAAIAMFSMQNPTSLCWAIEMWGYAILGVATWVLSPYYKDNAWVKRLLVANGVVSIASAFAVVYDPKWVFTTGGLVGYTVWNLLMIVLVTLIYRDAKRKILA